MALLVSSRAEAQTQMEMNEQACAKAKAADDDLNTAYRALRDAIDDAGHRRALRDAQRAWVAFRDAELGSMFYVPPGGDVRVEYGSMYPVTRCSEEQVLTETRTEQLRQLLGPQRP